MGFLYYFSIFLIAIIPGTLCTSLQNLDADDDFDSPESGEISSSEYKFICPGFWGTYAHPEDCSKFYACYYNTAKDFPCPRNELYDHKQNRCRDKEKVKCGKRPNPYEKNPTTRPPTTTTSIPTTTTTQIPTTTEDPNKAICLFEFGRFADPLDCSKFYACNNFNPTLHQCPGKTLYDERREECREAKLVKCGNRPRGGGYDDYDESIIEKKEDFYCPYIWGTFAHPEDCAKYIVCVENTPTYYSCEENHLFDRKYKKCLPADRVDCDDRSNDCGNCRVTTPELPSTTTTTETSVTVIGDQSRAVCLFSYGRFAHPRDCSKFYACHSFVPFMQQCPGNTLYDEKREECREAKLVKCGNRPRGANYDDYDEGIVEKKEDFYCPYMWGTFAHPEDCSKYIECAFNKPTTFICPENYSFDRKHKKCLPSHQVDCDERPKVNRPNELINPVCLFPYGRFADPRDCSRFYACHFYNPTLHQCPPNTLYDAKREECRPAKQVKCDGRPRGIGYDDYEETAVSKKEDFYCPYIWGIFAHPEDCSKYIACAYNTPVYQSCKENELFDRRYRKCLPSYVVDCDDRGYPSGFRPMLPGNITTKDEDLTLPKEEEYLCPAPNGMYALPDCSMYLICVKNVAFIYKCEAGKLYDPSAQQCRPSVDCSGRLIPNGLNPTTPPTTTTTPAMTRKPPTPTTTPKRITTTRPVTRPPPPKPNQPPPTNCHKKDVNCIFERTKEVWKWFRCPQRYGLFAHPLSDRLYIQCHEWRPYLRMCNEESAFSPSFQACVWVGEYTIYDI